MGRHLTLVRDGCVVTVARARTPSAKMSCTSRCPCDRRLRHKTNSGHFKDDIESLVRASDSSMKGVSLRRRRIWKEPGVRGEQFAEGGVGIRFPTLGLTKRARKQLTGRTPWISAQSSVVRNLENPTMSLGLLNCFDVRT